MTALASRLLAEVIRIANEYRDGILDSSEMEREAAAALSAPEGDMALALEWVRDVAGACSDEERAALDCIEEAIAAYDPEHVGAFSGKLSGREAGVEVHVGADSVDLRWVSKEAKHSFNGRIGAHPLYTTPQLGGGVVEANALSADELVELDKLVADVGPQQALNMFVELRAQIAGKVDEADRCIAELKRRAAAPSAKGVAP